MLGMQYSDLNSWNILMSIIHWVHLHKMGGSCCTIVEAKLEFYIFYLDADKVQAGLKLTNTDSLCTTGPPGSIVVVVDKMSNNPDNHAISTFPIFFSLISSHTVMPFPHKCVVVVNNSSIYSV